MTDILQTFHWLWKSMEIANDMVLRTWAVAWPTAR